MYGREDLYELGQNGFREDGEERFFERKKAGLTKKRKAGLSLTLNKKAAPKCSRTRIWPSIKCARKRVEKQALQLTTVGALLCMYYSSPMYEYFQHKARREERKGSIRNCLPSPCLFLRDFTAFWVGKRARDLDGLARYPVMYK